MTLVGGEPTIRPDIIQVFCEEMPRRVCVVTNGTYPLKRFENLYFYWISLDGTEKVHDSIRGKVHMQRLSKIFSTIQKVQIVMANPLGKIYGLQ